MVKRVYGWKRDLPDERDFVKVTPPTPTPASVDLRSNCPPVWDQGDLGCCSGHAIAAAIEYEFIHAKQHDWMPSRLFIYYNEREIEGTVDQDCGARLRDGIKVVAKRGVCPESLWGYDISKFASKPKTACYQEALKNLALRYESVPQTAQGIEHVLAGGHPVIFGFMVYPSFETPQVAATGIAAMPKPGEQSVGGHAVLAVGYDKEKKQFLVRNSWGEKWGRHGYFYLPYDYMLSSELAHDFWAITVMSDGD